MFFSTSLSLTEFREQFASTDFTTIDLKDLKFVQEFMLQMAEIYPKEGARMIRDRDLLKSYFGCYVSIDDTIS